MAPDSPSSSGRSDDELRLLRAHVRDLVALLALPLLWREREPADICSSLAGTLRRLVRVELAYVRVECQEDGSVLEARDFAASPALEAAFEPLIEASRDPAAQRTVAIPGGELWTSKIVGELEGDRVLLLVGASREGFPTQVESALLRATMDQATLSIRAARLLGKERAARAQAERHAAQLRGLNEASLAMNSEAPAADILRTVTEKARVLLGAHKAVASLTPSLTQAIKVVSPSEQATTSAGDDAEPWLTAPLVARDGRSLGVIQLFREEEGEHGDGEEAILLQLAQIASVALENARLNAERADLLAREQAARADAEAANRLKDDFLATISHELRTPLNAMLGWVTMLRSGSLPADRRERALETIERNARAQAQLVDDLLDVSRIINGKLKIEVQAVDAGAIVEVTVESIRPSADAKGVALAHSIGPGCGVLADPARLQQIVLNLLTNAVKFTPKGGRVEVTVGRIESSVVIRVTDTGKGISREFLPHVFERFRQFDGSMGRAQGGLGLGLAIVLHLVDLHGGTVDAESEGLGRGATFTVRLPVAVPRALSTASPLYAAGEMAYASELEGLHVLAVDDEEDAREVLRTLLEGSGMRVTTAASTNEALAALIAERPDMLVSDIAMPGQDGFALIAQVRALPSEEGGRTPAVALTAFARAEERTRILRAGFNSHVPKPLEAAELIATLVAMWGSRPRA
jgi:signal transduction histidine kinase/CheY-like chemotaxis protein